MSALVLVDKAIIIVLFERISVPIFKTSLQNKQIVEVDEWLQILPSDIRQNEITVPNTPNNTIVVKFLKNCFFLTWKLKQIKNPVQYILIQESVHTSVRGHLPKKKILSSVEI